MPDARTLTGRIAAVRRAFPLTPGQAAAAEALLTDLVAAAARHGVTLADLDYAADLPSACVDVTRAMHR